MLGLSCLLICMVRRESEKIMDATNKTPSELIKKMRIEQGVTQSHLAMSVYSDMSSISRWERGDNITWFKFLEIAKALGYTVHIEVEEITE